jgi:metal-responsive CopG/Arc/MetJ family transcriptional regulator
MLTVTKSKVRSFGVSLPQTLFEKLDVIRGDINRSRYIQRLIESKIAILQIQPQVAPQEESVVSTTNGLGVPKAIG